MSYVKKDSLLAGGNWDNATSCSSQSRNGNNVRSTVNANIGSRGVIRILCEYLAIFVGVYLAELITLSLGQNTKLNGV